MPTQNAKYGLYLLPRDYKFHENFYFTVSLSTAKQIHK